MQILHQKYEVEMKMNGMQKTKEHVEEMNLKLQAVSYYPAIRLVKYLVTWVKIISTISISSISLQ